MEFQNKIVGQEVQYSFFMKIKIWSSSKRKVNIFNRSRRPLVRYGFIRKVELNHSLNFNFDFFPGVYLKNNEEDLGGWIMFRSGIELEYSINTDWKISLGYDHRSSGDIWEYNPGHGNCKKLVFKTWYLV